MKGFMRQWGLLLMILFSTFSQADENVDAVIRKAMAMAVPELKITSIEATPVAGLFEVSFDGERPLYVSADGSFLLTGDIYALKGHRVTNISEQKRELVRAKLLASVNEKDLIVYKPEGEIKSVVSIFTDIDCPYCRKMHQEIPALNEMGIQVNYFAYPRAGVGSSSYFKIVSAWCADNPPEAMNQAKAGKVLPRKDCANPVANHLALGQKVGVSGTPAIVTQEGKLLPGYLPAKELVKELSL